MSNPLFKFGVISDIQYANANDAWNFQQTKKRRYRNSLSVFRHAVETWRNQHEVDFSLILGDLVDGRASVLNEQHQALQDLQEIADKLGKPSYYCFGNHCHYCFSRNELRDVIIQSFTTKHPGLHNPMKDLAVISALTLPSASPFKSLNYTFQVNPGWRFISLDGYDVSLIASSSACRAALAKQIISLHNPNDLSISTGWFKGLTKENMRYVPYNGGISQSQLSWLNDTLAACHINKEKAMIFCHQPIFSPNKPSSLIWNAEEVLSTLHQYPGTVVMWLAGHDHGGQSAVDEAGIHHIVPPAPIECELEDTAFGTVEVYDDHVKLLWKGSPPASPWHPWPHVIDFSN